MTSQKIDNEINLALDISPEELEKTRDLKVGYEPKEKKWQLIIKYEGSLAKVRQLSDFVVELLGGYAVITIAEDLINVVSDLEEVIYIEKPKRLNFQIDNGVRISCINPVKREPFSLSGEGIILAFLDSGIDYGHEAFINESGTTRILELWDQTLDRIFTRDDINRALQANMEQRGDIVPSRDVSGHGTAVASIAAAVAPGSDIIAVKLGNPMSDSFPRTSELMMALDYVVRRGLYYGRPVAVNISIGNNYGSHDGTSLLATYIDTVAAMGRMVIAVGTGNEGASSTHTGGVLVDDSTDVVELSVGNYEASFNIQLWKSYADNFQVSIKAPSGAETGYIRQELGVGKYNIDSTDIYVYFGEPSPYSPYQEIYIELIPGERYIESGTWQLILTPIRIVDGQYDMWLPVERTSKDTRFLRPTPDTTLTVPSTAGSVISVGAYDPYTDAYADFSGRGYTRVIGEVKPDIVTPGVNIVAASPSYGLANNNYIRQTGTSFATPFVTGSAALMMEWGIIKGNDPYLYGEKVKAYLIRGARQLPGFDRFPNPQVGWGALCLRDSFA